MIIRGKEIKGETITMWLNVISFLISIIFYADVIFKFSHSPEPIAQANEAKDSLLVIDAKLHEQLRAIQITQDSILHELHNTQANVVKATQKEVSERRQIYSTIHSSWDKLPQQSKDNYVNGLLVKLRKHQI